MKNKLVGTDIPVGLGLILEGEKVANDNFHALTDVQKSSLINYIQGATTGEESKDRIVDVVDKLKNSTQNNNITTYLDDRFY